MFAMSQEHVLSYYFEAPVVRWKFVESRASKVEKSGLFRQREYSKYFQCQPSTLGVLDSKVAVRDIYKDPPGRGHKGLLSEQGSPYG